MTKQLKAPKNLHQVRKELGRIYAYLARNPNAVPYAHALVRPLGRMIDAAAVAVVWSRLSGRKLPKHTRKFIEGK